MNSLRILTASCVLAGAVYAQQPSIHEQEIARARLLMHSASLAEKAWGVYFAGRLHAPELAEELLNELQSSVALADSPASSETHFYVAEVFDAAIESNLPVPSELLDQFPKTWSDPVLILLSRRVPDRSGIKQRSAAESSWDGMWLAANNLLFAEKNPDWYRKLVGDISFTHRVVAIDQSPARAGVSGPGGGVCGDGVYTVPPGFPPVTQYTLEINEQPGEILLAKGPVNAYYQKHVTEGGKPGGFGSCGMLNRQEIREKYLAALAQSLFAKVQATIHAETQISFDDSDHFRTQATNAMSRQEDAVRLMLRAVQDRDRLLGCTGVIVRIVAEVEDRRGHREVPLPTIEERLIVLN